MKNSAAACVASVTLRVAATAALAFLVGLAPIAAKAVTVRDASGRTVDVEDASRLISIGGALTEILYELGLSDQVVAVDTTSVFPSEALKTKPNVGYMRALSAEGILGLNPSAILAIDGAGPKETLAVLESAAVPLVRVPDRYDGEGIVEKIMMVADITGSQERGRCLANSVARDLYALAHVRAMLTQHKKVMFVISLLNGKPMVAGRNTAADGIIRLAGGVNAVDAYEGYKQMSDEAVGAADPDTILVMQRPQEGLDAKTVFANAAFALTNAAKQNSFIAMDGLYLLGFGPRTARAARDLAAQLYPSMGREALPSETAERNCAQ